MLRLRWNRGAVQDGGFQMKHCIFFLCKGCLVLGVIDQVSRAGHLGVIRLAFSTFPSL